MLGSLLIVREGIASNADRSSAASTAIGLHLAERLSASTDGERLVAQTSGSRFERLCADFLQRSFELLTPIRPGDWRVECVGGRNRSALTRFAQYEHLGAMYEAARANRELRVVLGGDYTITPDIVISRERLSDEEINRDAPVVDGRVAKRTSLRAANGSTPILHASLSCKWTLRSDRAQNARSEALNLIRLRKGSQPHIAVITGEPLPSRIASIALGTGDIDCVYHIALPELIAAVDACGFEDAREMLSLLVEGNRLRDIADLPLDLAV